MRPLCNLHTHTNICDGSDSPEEMVLAAIRAGCDVLGFSEHSPLYNEVWTMSSARIDDYKNEIKRLKTKYEDKIEILLGIEYDCFSEISKNGYDYIIGSVHAVKKCNKQIYVDESQRLLMSDVCSYYSGDYMAYIREYYCLVADLKTATNCDIAGHIDLIVKHNAGNALFDENSAEYKKYALEALDALLEQDIIIEINTGGMSRGYRKAPYPAPFLLKHIAEYNGRVMFNSDCHSKEHILFYYAESLELAKSCGIKSHVVVENGKFVTKGL